MRNSSLTFRILSFQNLSLLSISVGIIVVDTPPVRSSTPSLESHVNKYLEPNLTRNALPYRSTTYSSVITVSFGKGFLYQGNPCLIWMRALRIVQRSRVGLKFFAVLFLFFGSRVLAHWLSPKRRGKTNQS